MRAYSDLLDTHEAQTMSGYYVVQARPPAYLLVLLVWRTDLKLEDQVQAAWAAAAVGQARQDLQCIGEEMPLLLLLLLLKLLA